MAKSANNLRRWQEAGLLRDLDVHLVESLMRTCCGERLPPPAVQVALALAVRVTGDGHVCLDLNRPQWEQINLHGQNDDPSGASGTNALTTELPAPQEAADLLRACPELVGDGSGAEPFILAEGRLYLRRFWNYEQLTADKLRAWSATRYEVPADTQATAQAVTLRKKGPRGEALYLTTEQVAAVCAGLERQLTVITGGPGTGKTTIAAVLLNMLARQSDTRARPLRVRLAAPTGKAADRLQESVNAEMDDSLEHLILEPAKTLDSLLGYQPASPYFRHNRNNPLPADVVLVDETSMADLPKFAKLLDALAPNTRLILLGDKNQLASVDPGSVMAELCESETLRNNVVVLTQSKRFDDDSLIKRLSEAVNDMRADEAWEIVSAQTDAANSPMSLHDASRIRFNHIPPEFTKIIETRYAAFQAARTAKEAFAALAQFRVLCALRRGPLGVNAINRAIEDILFPTAKASSTITGSSSSPATTMKSSYSTAMWACCRPERENEHAVFLPIASSRFRAGSCRNTNRVRHDRPQVARLRLRAHHGHAPRGIAHSDARTALHRPHPHRNRRGPVVYGRSFKTAVSTQTARRMGLKSKLYAAGAIGSSTDQPSPNE